MAEADSILVYKLTAPKQIRWHRDAFKARAEPDSAKRTWLIAGAVPDTVVLLGSSLVDRHSPVGSVGYVASSPGRRLDGPDRANLMTLWGEPGAHEKGPAYRCVFDPVIVLRIYRGAEVGEALMETDCLRWVMRGARFSAGGSFQTVLDDYRRFAMGVFRGDPVMLRELERMH